MRLNPRSLSFDEAAKLLLPKRYGIGSPNIRPWEPWTRPLDPKSIDDEVAKQIERRDQCTKNPHMRTRAELDGIRISCPYAHARLAVALAAGDGTHDLEANQAAKPAPVGNGASEQHADYARAADGLAKEIGAFLTRDLNWGLGDSPRPASARRDHNEANERLRRVHAAQDQVAAAQEALKVLAAAARENKEQLIPSHSTGDLWRQAFVMRMGIAWRSLTGCNPAPSSAHFSRFVAAGYNSLGPGVMTDAYEWRNHIKTACERMAKRPEWDRWDREERDTLPPGTTVIPYSQHLERKRLIAQERDALILEYLDATTPEEARAAWLELASRWSWFPNTPQGQRDIARLQAEPPTEH